MRMSRLLALRALWLVKKELRSDEILPIANITIFWRVEMLISLAIFYLLPVGGFAAFSAVILSNRRELPDGIALHAETAMTAAPVAMEEMMSV